MGWTLFPVIFADHWLPCPFYLRQVFDYLELHLHRPLIGRRFFPFCARPAGYKFTVSLFAGVHYFPFNLAALDSAQTPSLLLGRCPAHGFLGRCNTPQRPDQRVPNKKKRNQVYDLGLARAKIRSWFLSKNRFESAILTKLLKILPPMSFVYDFPKWDNKTLPGLLSCS